MSKKTLITTALITGITLSFASNLALAKKGHGHHGGQRGAPTSHFDRLDTDGDGLITETEFTEAKTKRLSRRFDRMDSDNDELISQEEFEAKTNRHLDRLGIDAEEMETCMAEELGDDFQAKPDWEALTTAADTDVDSYISEDELTVYKTALAAEKFAELDANTDANLDEDEFAVLADEKAAKREARRTCVDTLLDQ